jgi:hypothetical protein
MTNFELIACRHLDACIEAGEIKANTALAIRELFRIAKERDILLERLAVAEEAMKNANSKILEGIPYGPSLGPIVDAARDILFEALSKIRGENV